MSNDEYQQKQYFEMKEKINKKTGLVTYQKGYWHFMFKTTNNWIGFLFTLAICIGAPIKSKVMFGAVSYASLSPLIILAFMAYYNYYCWKERKRGETS